MSFKWNKVAIKTPQGPVTGIAPWIVSASRATDIPAYYGDWFFNKLEKGYVAWINPFNRHAPQYVSFSNVQVIIFWSKNPLPIMPYLDRLECRGIACYFQFTLNDYETQKFEPGLPSLTERIETFQALSEKLGKERLIWRFDPLVMTKELGINGLAEKIEQVGSHLHPYTEKLVFSFADIANYKKVRNNLEREGIRYTDFDKDKMVAMANEIQNINRFWGLSLATCGEDLDLSEFGIFHNKCIDDELILRITAGQKRSPAFEKFLGFEQQSDLFDMPPAVEGTKKVSLKDKGQRRECGCIYSKDIGSYNTCTHGCVYCYANSSAAAAEKNRQKVCVESPSLLPAF